MTPRELRGTELSPVPENSSLENSLEYKEGGLLLEIGDMLQQAEELEQDREETQESLKKEIDNIDSDLAKDFIKQAEEARISLKEQLAAAAKHFRKKIKVYSPLLFLLLLQYPHNEARDTDKEIAKKQLQKNGITVAQKKRYIPGVSEFLYKVITPYEYSFEDTSKRYQRDKNPGREDAWRLYLGLDQENNTFGISEYRPTNSKDNKYYYKINSFLENYTSFNAKTNLKMHLGEGENGALKKFYRDPNPIKQLLKDVLFQAKPTEDEKKDNEWHIANSIARSDGANNIMGKYTLSQGVDEKGHYISYYDRWDLGGSLIEGKDGNVGTPFEIYDRIYYDPEILDIIDDSR